MDDKDKPGRPVDTPSGPKPTKRPKPEQPDDPPAGPKDTLDFRVPPERG